MKTSMKYIVINCKPGYGKKRIGCTHTVTALLLKEYPYFYLFQGKNYRFTVSKAGLMCGHYRMRRAGEAA